MIWKRKSLKVKIDEKGKELELRERKLGTDESASKKSDKNRSQNFPSRDDMRCLLKEPSCDGAREKYYGENDIEL